LGDTQLRGNEQGRFAGDSTATGQPVTVLSVGNEDDGIPETIEVDGRQWV
jgi:hypothetical protein